MSQKTLKIEIEGTDGAGKTTGMEYFVKKLQEAGSTVLETREVGSKLIPTNVKLRELVLSPESELSGEAMELIFCAMRFENDKYYKTEGQNYDYIVSDRGWLSHLAYTDHNVSNIFTSNLYNKFMKKYTDLPDIVIYFDINTETALSRRVKRGEAEDAIEAKGIEFQENVRKSFEEHIHALKWDNVQVFKIDANQSLENVQKQLDDILLILKGDKVHEIIS